MEQSQGRCARSGMVGRPGEEAREERAGGDILGGEALRHTAKVQLPGHRADGLRASRWCTNTLGYPWYPL